MIKEFEQDLATSEEEEEEEIDTSWIDHFKKDNEKYSDFYTEEVTNITLFFIYINHKNDVENLSRDLMILDRKNTVMRDQLIQIIKQNQTHNNNNNKYKYKLISLLKYNIDIEPEEIYNFINNKDDSSFSKRFFIQEKYLNDIIYKNTINIFQDLNSLFFIYKETSPIANNNSNNNNNITKKTIIFSQTRKTRRRKL
jgi:predicted transcriptional regulator